MKTLRMSGIEFEEGKEYVLVSRESFVIVVALACREFLVAEESAGRRGMINERCFNKYWEFMGEL